MNPLNKGFKISILTDLIIKEFINLPKKDLLQVLDTRLRPPWLGKMNIILLESRD